MKLIIVLISIFTPCLLFAQPAPTPAPLPKGPLLARAPEFSRWVISYKPSKGEQEPSEPQDAQTGSPKVQQIVVTKTKNIYHEEIFYKSGAPRNSWKVGAMQIAIDPRSKDIRMSDSVSNDAAFGGNYSMTDFPGLEWISKKTYVDVKKIGGVDCIIFKQSPPAATELAEMLKKGEDLSGRAPEELEVELTAYVDMATRLPIYFQLGGDLRAYQFQVIPAVMQELPQEVKAALNRRVQTSQEMTRRPPPPF